MIKVDVDKDLEIKRYVVENGEGVAPVIPGVNIEEVLDGIKSLDVRYMSMREFDKYAVKMKELETCAGLTYFMFGDNDAQVLSDSDVAKAKGYLEFLNIYIEEIQKAMGMHIVSCTLALDEDDRMTEFKRSARIQINNSLQKRVKIKDVDLIDDLYMNQMEILAKEKWRCFDTSKKASFHTFAFTNLFKPKAVGMDEFLKSYHHTYSLDYDGYGDGEDLSIIDNESQKNHEKTMHDNSMIELLNEIKTLTLNNNILSEELWEILIIANDTKDGSKKECSIGECVNASIGNKYGKFPYTDKQVSSMLGHAKEKIERAMNTCNKKYLPELEILYCMATRGSESYESRQQEKEQKRIERRVSRIFNICRQVNLFSGCKQDEDGNWIGDTQAFVKAFDFLHENGLDKEILKDKAFEDDDILRWIANNMITKHGDELESNFTEDEKFELWTYHVDRATLRKAQFRKLDMGPEEYVRSEMEKEKCK